MKEIRWLAGIWVALWGATVAGATPTWEGLKAGLEPNEVRGLLGEPLMINGGRGFEVWIYDEQREVVWLRGVVVAWTARDVAADARGRDMDLRGLAKARAEKAKAVVEKQKVYVPRSEQNFGYEKSATGRMKLRAF